MDWLTLSLALVSASLIGLSLGLLGSGGSVTSRSNEYWHRNCRRSRTRLWLTAFVGFHLLQSSVTKPRLSTGGEWLGPLPPQWATSEGADARHQSITFDPCRLHHSHQVTFGQSPRLLGRIL